RLVGGPDGDEISKIAYDASFGQLGVIQRSESVHRFIIDPSMRPIVVRSVKIPRHWPQAVTFGQTGVRGPELWSFGREDSVMQGIEIKNDGVRDYSGHAAINVKEDTLIIDNVSQGVAVKLRFVAFHDGNSAIVTGSDHGKVYIFDRRTGNIIDTIYIGVDDWVQSIASVEEAGVPLILIGRSGENIGKTEIYVWEKVMVPAKVEKVQRGFRIEVRVLLWFFSVLFVLENLLICTYLNSEQQEPIVSPTLPDEAQGIPIIYL
ncbi:hypothetical protein GGU11DRAFT_761613, partial [Lentinula aff. detonsa]